MVGFGNTRIHTETATFELRASEVAARYPAFSSSSMKGAWLGPGRGPAQRCEARAGCRAGQQVTWNSPTLGLRVRL
jgi:hypothetical protein